MHHLFRILALPLFLFSATPIAAQEALSDPRVMAIHDGLLTIDSHIDIGTGYGTARLDPGVLNPAQVDLPSMRIGGLDAGFFVVYIPQGELSENGYRQAFEAAEEGYRGIVRMLRANRDSIGLATSAEGIETLHGQGKLVALIGMENAYPLGATPQEVEEAVERWKERGLAYASITHFGHNQFGGSSNPSVARGEGEDPGLTDLGRVLISELNDHGIMVDVSHAGPQTVADAIAASRTPIIASHSTIAAVHNNPRGLTDEQLIAIRDSGGVVQVTAFRSYLADIDPRIAAAMSILRNRLGLNTGADFRAATPEVLLEYVSERARIREAFEDVTLARFMEHLDHAVSIAGIDHVGISGDFDGGGGVEGWDSAADSPNVTAALLERGYAQEEIAKIWGGNLLRVMGEVERAATN
ncbi:MAG: dipeptidase [Pseudomonadota bacterium]